MECFGHFTNLASNNLRKNLPQVNFPVTPKGVNLVFSRQFMQLLNRFLPSPNIWLPPNATDLSLPMDNCVWMGAVVKKDVKHCTVNTPKTQVIYEIVRDSC